MYYTYIQAHSALAASSDACVIFDTLTKMVKICQKIKIYSQIWPPQAANFLDLYVHSALAASSSCITLATLAAMAKICEKIMMYSQICLPLPANFLAL